LSLFIYDFIRLLLMLGLLTFLPPLGNMDGTAFPYLVFAASNALYPLMSLFLWLKLEDYIPYLPLYAAGKFIAAAAAFAWFFLSAPKLAAHPALDWTGVLAALVFDMVIIAADTGSACGALLLKSKISPAKAGTLQEGL
jgi:hypothetical protein